MTSAFNSFGLIVLIMALGIFIVLPIVAFFSLMRRAKTRWIRQVSVTFVVASIAMLGLFLWHIRKPRIVARAVTPDGVELRVIQGCNWDPEGFYTSVYYRKPGSPWGWFYYDHQDIYWGSGRAEVNPQAKRITIYRAGRVTATFDWETERFVLLRQDCAPRESIGAQGCASPPL